MGLAICVRLTNSAELKLETHLFDEANSMNSKIKPTKKVGEKTHKDADLVPQP
jgi:hypothetical protein